MTVVFIAPSFFPDHTAGTELYTLHLAKGLQMRGWNISIVVPSVQQKPPYFYEGLEVYSYYIPKHYIPGNTELEKTTHSFLKIIHQLSPDIVHFQGANMRSIPSELVKAVSELGLNVFLTPHLAGFFCLRGNLLENGEKPCDGKMSVQRCGSCFYSDKSAKIASMFRVFPPWVTRILSRFKPSFNYVNGRQEDLQSLGQLPVQNIALALWIEKVFRINKMSRVQVVSQGVLSVPTAPESKDQPITADLLFVGRCSPIKGLDLVVESLKAMSNPPCLKCLVLVSTPLTPYEERMKKEVLLLGGEWMENLDNQEVHTAMYQARCLILPSQSEMAPLVALEAIQCKLPIIGSSIPAIQEVIEEYQCGWMFKSQDRESLTKVISMVFRDRSALNRIRSEMKSVRTFNLVVSEMEKIYQQTK